MAPGTSQNTETIAFSLPPERAQRLREVAGEEETEWRASERMRRRSRQYEPEDNQGGHSDE